jgi:RpiB/LacA/LacB family sugar-phosphate isomerase
MKIYIGADHRGFKLKGELIAFLVKSGHDVVDVGAFLEEPPCDYPEISYKVASAVAKTKNARGILVCMSGIGHAIAANKIKGAYAALCYNKKTAKLSREHNNANILVLGARFVAPKNVKEIVKVWLRTKFAGGRHARRLEQIKRIESGETF